MIQAKDISTTLLRGKVVEQAREGAIDRLAKKYLGVDKYPLRSPNQKRIV
jgi:hypothetical protein